MAGLAHDKSLTTGHEFYPPTKVNSSQTKVFVDGIPVAREDDKIDRHTRIVEEHETHGGTVISRTAKVFVKGKKAAQIGDSISCGDMISQSSNKVFING